jgi:hypothetical protein
MTRAVVVAASVLACAWPLAAFGAAPRLAAETSLEPSPSQFGDALVAELEVRFDPATIDPRSIRVETDFTPYAPEGPPEVVAARSGSGQRLVRYRYHLSCLTAACLPTRGERAVALAPSRVTAAAGSRTVTVQVRWPSALVRPRIRPADLARSPRFRSPVSSNRTPFRTAPGPLVAGLFALASLLGVAGLLLAGRELARLLRSRRPPTPVDALETALRYTRESALRPSPADRRKALGLLADALDDRRLAETAGGAAWSEPPPPPARALEVADEVETARRAR